MKTFKGTVVSTKMKDTVVVMVSRRTPHPLYKKLLKKSSKFKVSAPENKLSVGEIVTIVETRPIAKGVHFKLMDGKAKPAVVETSASQGRAKK